VYFVVAISAGHEDFLRILAGVSVVLNFGEEVALLLHIVCNIGGTAGSKTFDLLSQTARRYTASSRSVLLKLKLLLTQPLICTDGIPRR
jgi:hypothetical protein